jgi:hypothetical protein
MGEKLRKRLNRSRPVLLARLGAAFGEVIGERFRIPHHGEEIEEAPESQSAQRSVRLFGSDSEFTPMGVKLRKRPNSSRLALLARLVRLFGSDSGFSTVVLKSRKRPNRSRPEQQRFGICYHGSGIEKPTKLKSAGFARPFRSTTAAASSGSWLRRTRTALRAPPRLGSRRRRGRAILVSRNSCRNYSSAFLAFQLGRNRRHR